ncbi:hypothetical protein PTI45_00299 [Paenibacillus nuruki]|uniref:Uncharacterized protein n=1 Tax=Paenibacillus nuruki TaxID=1886670 RepID=A0A1E3L8V4_9BACL|nr:hypothetical protein [Paenibacillus nuruki]ODP30229.1 hypothetical protein PTI45_00299 [Paenibacillus nuruki]
MSKLIVFIGAIMFISGTLLLGMTQIAVANFVPNVPGWSTPPGRFFTAMEELSLQTPYRISILFMIVGLLFFAVVLIKIFREKYNNKLKSQEEQ